MTLRELKYVILGDDKLSDKMGRIAAASDKTKKALGDHSDKVGGLRKKYSEAAQAVPALGIVMDKVGLSMSAVVNPITVSAAAVVGLGLALTKGAEASDLFSSKYRELININLDKTEGQISGLRDKMLSLSATNGFDAGKTSGAYFDVQSILGVGGKPVEDIIAKVGKFSQVFQSDFNETIAGAASAVKNFGLSLNDVDKYLASSQKTVSAARISYVELSKLQPMFTGAAKSAFQTVDSANQLFAVFSSYGASAEERATLVKSAFTDMFKAPTIKAFEKLGISLFKDGIPKQVPQIITELNQAFIKASETGGAQAMNDLKNQFSGSEGINTLLSAAMDTSGKTLKTLQSYTGAVTDYQKALKYASEDINYQQDLVKNKLNTALISLGDSLTPLRLKWTLFKKDVVDTLSILTGANTSRNLYNEKGRQAVMSNTAYNLDGLSQEQQQKMIPELMKKSKSAHALGKSTTNADLTSFQTGLMIGYSELMQRIRNGDTQIVKPEDSLFGGVGTNPPPTPDPTIKNQMSGISGGGVRNVTVTFKNLVENFTVQTTNIKDGSSVIKEDIQKVLVKAVAGAEQIIGAN